MGGLVGAAGGGLFSVFDELALGGGMGRAWGLSIMGTFAAIGLVAGGYIAHTVNKDAYADNERARLDAQYGVSTLGFARGLMTKFDHNDNGRIDLDNQTGLASMDERLFGETQNRSNTRLKYDWSDQGWDTETERWSESRNTSAGNIWNAADTDPKDGVITDVELAHLMARFDQDKSGSLTTAEQQAFKQAHPVIVDQWAR